MSTGRHRLPPPSVAPAHGADGGPSSAVRVVALPSAPSADAELLLGLVARKPRAVAETFDRFAPLVRSLLTRMLGDASDVDDLTQETFLILLRRCRDIDDASKLRSFVVGTAIRTAKNEVRKRKIRRWIGLEDATVELRVEPCDAATLERIRRLYAALDRLDGDGRTLFVLRYVEGMELEEIAGAIGCSLATVKRRLTRASKRFRAIACVDPALRDYLKEDQS